MPSPPAISTIVCTRDRPDDLRRALRSLVAQAFGPYEVIVVDQSRTEETRRVVDEASRARCTIRYLHLAEPGLSRAYNTGISVARGDLLAFTDDDCVAPPQWLHSVAVAFADEPEVGLLYGQVLLPPDLDARDGGDGFTPQLPIERRRRLSRRDGFRVFGMGANFAARRSVCQEMGGFDEVLGGGGPLQSAQDFDFAYRLFRRGGAILLDPGVVVHHYGFRSLGDWPAVVRSYGVGVGGFYWKHVRLGDRYAAQILAATLARETAGVVKKVLLRRPASAQWNYVRSICTGIARSRRYHVDARRRVYLAATPAVAAG